MSSAESNTHLRLAGQSHIDSHLCTSQRKREIARENLNSASNPTLDPTDPRWVLATRVYAMLDGDGLTPAARQRANRIAQLIGVRPFDTNLIIAAVQDRARRGQPLADAAPVVAMVGENDYSKKTAVRPGNTIPEYWRWAMALVMAVGVALLMIRWVGGA